MVSLVFSDVTTPDTYPGKYQLLLGVEASLTLAVDKAVVMEEPDFPIVELRQWLKQWLDTGAQGDFSYRSIEADEDGLIVFRRVGKGMGEVDSAWSSLSKPSVAPWPVILDACRDYVSAVDQWVAANYGSSTEDLLQDMR